MTLALGWRVGQPPPPHSEDMSKLTGGQRGYMTGVAIGTGTGTSGLACPVIDRHRDLWACLPCDWEHSVGPVFTKAGTGPSVDGPLATCLRILDPVSPSHGEGWASSVQALLGILVPPEKVLPTLGSQRLVLMPSSDAVGSAADPFPHLSMALCHRSESSPRHTGLCGTSLTLRPSCVPCWLGPGLWLWELGIKCLLCPREDLSSAP